MAGNSRDGDHSSDHDPLDEQWDAIVSRLGELDQSTGATMPAESARDGGDQSTGEKDAVPDDGWSAIGLSLEGDSAATPLGVGPRDWDEPIETDYGFVPPDPGPLKPRDPISAAAWITLVVSAAALVILGFGIISLSQIWLTIAGIAFLGAIVTLFMRMPSGKEPTDPDDDGAVV